jgi:methionyl-tRNA formyltransferase
VNSVRIVFAGSPAAAVPSLRSLTGSRHEVVAVVTRDDSTQGRRKILTPTAVATVAAELGLPLIKANRLVGEATNQIAGAQPDLGVIVAYGGLVREPLLSVPRLGWINLHFSLLPRWRGAAPIQRAIIAGDDITGASVFRLVEELDAGELYGQLTREIRGRETAGQVLDSLAQSGATLLGRVVDAIADGTARAESQQGDVTLAPKLTREDGRIDFEAQPSTVINLIRGVTPEPGAFTSIDGSHLKVLDARMVTDVPALSPGQLAQVGGRLLAGTAGKPIELITVHPAGKKAMAAIDWWRGRPATASAVAQ